MHLISSKRPPTVWLWQACILCIVQFNCCNTSPGKAEKEVKEKSETPVVATQVIEARKGKLSASLRVPGELIPFEQVDLYAKENSFVKKIYVDVGSEVKTGQLLATLDAPEITSRLAEVQSRLQSQEAIYAASKASYDRLNETSKTPGTISPSDLEQAEAQKNSQYAQLQAARSVYKQVSDTRNYLEIRAPFAGIVSARNVNTGAYVGPSGKGSDTPLFVLQQQKKLRLVVSVPEAFAGLLSKQDEVNFTIKSMPDQNFKAKVNRLAGTLDDRLRSERVEMDVLNENKKLLPGMYAEVNLPMPANDSSFIVPKLAVVTSSEKVFVIRVTDKKAEWVDVKKGREAEGKIEIFGNLSPGDHLVKTASDEIRNGSPIENEKLVE